MLRCNSYVWRIIAVSFLSLYSSARPPAPQSLSSQLLHRPSNWALFFFPLSLKMETDILIYRFFLSAEKYSQMWTQNNNVAEKHNCWAGICLLKKKKAGLIFFPKCNKSSTPAHLCSLVKYQIRFNKKLFTKDCLRKNWLTSLCFWQKKTLLQVWYEGGLNQF